MENADEVIEALCRIVELKTGITREEFLEYNRKRKFVIARCLYVNLLNVYTDLSEAEISKLIDKDRATVYYMYRIHDDYISVDKTYTKMFHECSDKYIAMVCTNKYLMIEPAILMDRLKKVENEIKEIKEILKVKSSIKSNDELVTG